MRTISAALFGASAVLPLLAHATALSDPTDAAISVPAVTVRSAFDGYRSYWDGEAPSWQSLNRAVTPGHGRAGMQQCHQSGDASARKKHEHGGESE
ncbi:conserved hypothetical protein [Paraburkholderia atlantica]|uniref:Uncharacterized protein n=1 Tax=Paraburkholderia atlantica TaxID=2654982 RepID=D5WJY0_PARAM|nr:hypothetical protein [Paraburkholderia atlantica]ADG19526.1 conserved hypothetical protein [Paraburkholderia atlantica]